MNIGIKEQWQKKDWYQTMHKKQSWGVSRFNLYLDFGILLHIHRHHHPQSLLFHFKTSYLPNGSSVTALSFLILSHLTPSLTVSVIHHLLESLSRLFAICLNFTSSLPFVSLHHSSFSALTLLLPLWFNPSTGILLLLHIHPPSPNTYIRSIHSSSSPWQDIL